MEVTRQQIQVDNTRSNTPHQISYLSCGPQSGPLLVFVHGWPELAISWRHQLPVFGGLGFHAVALDTAGYGESSVYDQHSDYAIRHLTNDLLGLLDHLNREQAVWIGHDWGSPVVWSLVRHHPERCLATASLCVPYQTLELGVDACIALVNRDRYPIAEFPAGQWDYQLFYEESFDVATKAFDADPYQTVKLLFRAGDPAGYGKPAATAFTRANGGWFGDAQQAPDVPRDPNVVSEEDLQTYAQSLAAHSFFGPDSYYMNHTTNAEFAASAPGSPQLDKPTLLLHARYDSVCDTMTSELARPMREWCSRLSEQIIDSGHWMAQEKPQAVNAAIARWLALELPDYWPAT